MVQIKEGYLYHIKDSFFDIVKDKSLMSNHEKEKTNKKTKTNKKFIKFCT